MERIKAALHHGKVNFHTISSVSSSALKTSRSVTARSEAIQAIYVIAMSAVRFELLSADKSHERESERWRGCSVRESVVRGRKAGEGVREAPAGVGGDITFTLGEKAQLLHLSFSCSSNSIKVDPIAACYPHGGWI